jgi:hypothetical protein
MLRSLFFALGTGMYLGGLTVQVHALPQVQAFVASAPVRLPQGYHIQIDLRLHNPSAQADIPASLQFRFVPDYGDSVVCRNLTLPSAWPTPEIISLPGLAAGAEQHLYGLILVPVHWYRGRAHIVARLESCDANPCTPTDIQWHETSADIYLY